MEFRRVLFRSRSAATPNRNIPMSPLSEIESFSHDHVYLGSSHDENARRTLWVVALTAVMMVGEIIAGYLTGSMALLADGFHMATHAGALGVAAVAYAYAKRRSEEHTSELQSLMRISYAVFCLKKKKTQTEKNT